MTILVQVNGDEFEINEAIRRSIWNDNQFLDNFVEELLIRRYAAQHNISNTDEELQVALDEMRYSKALESVEALKQWLKSNLLTILSLQNSIDYSLLCMKVRNSIPESEVKAYFVEHQLDFEQVELYSIRTNSIELAEELYTQITEEGKDFHLLAMQYSLDEKTKPKAGYVGNVTREELSDEIAVAVFNAHPGEVISPIKTEKGYNLFKVTAIYPADLEAEKDNIRIQLYQKILSRLRSEVKISYPTLEEK